MENFLEFIRLLSYLSGHSEHNFRRSNSRMDDLAKDKAPCKDVAECTRGDVFLSR